jgi:hypothetical protein
MNVSVNVNGNVKSLHWQQTADFDFVHLRVRATIHLAVHTLVPTEYALFLPCPPI